MASIMEQGMGSGVTAGRVYLALLLAQESPIYSLFSPLAFQTLFRCIRCSCKPIVKPSNDEAGPSNYQGKKLKKKGKRARDLYQEREHDANMEIEDESVCRASFKDIVALIKELAMVQNIIGDAGLEVLGNYCKKLRSLRIEYLEDQHGFVSHRGLLYLAQNCRCLQSVAIYASDITSSALSAFGESCPNLVDFRIALLIDIIRPKGLALSGAKTDVCMICLLLNLQSTY